MRAQVSRLNGPDAATIMVYLYDLGRKCCGRGIVHDVYIVVVSQTREEGNNVTVIGPTLDIDH